jgi:glycolate oxidase iron-sulfur subunit
MQTNFSPAQRLDPAIAESEKILRACVHCGFCTATCPTYVTLGDELDSPRGRIYLIKDMLESGAPAEPTTVKHIDRCLSCLSCMTTCPSGVHYMHLVDHARTYIHKTYQRPLADRTMRWLLATILPYPGRFRLALRAARLSRFLAPLLGNFGAMGKRMAAMLHLAPTQALQPNTLTSGQVFGQPGSSTIRVAILSGCAQQVLQPSISEATVELLNRVGVSVVVPAGEGCCGSLVHHMGQEHAAHSFAKANIDAWMHEINGDGLDAILITTSGCGTTIKDYGYMLRDDPQYAEKASLVSSLAKDVSEYLATLTLPAASPRLMKVAYHSACSLQHGQNIGPTPKELLSNAGFEVAEVGEGHLCCGSAGTYNIMQPALATSLRDRKIANIEKLQPDVIAAGNIGCLTQIESGTAIPAIHTVELLNWAYGGNQPVGLPTEAAKPTVDDYIRA